MGTGVTSVAIDAMYASIVVGTAGRTASSVVAIAEMRASSGVSTAVKTGWTVAMLVGIPVWNVALTVAKPRGSGA